MGCSICLSYIKPQHVVILLSDEFCCSICLSYIKPQLTSANFTRMTVVLYVYPTSNHNSFLSSSADSRLFYMSILHQTTTVHACSRWCRWLFYMSILHQTTTEWRQLGRKSMLFYMSILHQTTTSPRSGHKRECCSICLSYIKPQPPTASAFPSVVVLYVYPTSNHNLFALPPHNTTLFYMSILHQTTTCPPSCRCS